MHVTQRLIMKDFSRAIKRNLWTHALVSKFKSRKIYNHDGKKKLLVLKWNIISCEVINLPNVTEEEVVNLSITYASSCYNS